MPPAIHDLLAKYFSGQTTPEEEQLISSWMEQSEENRAEVNLLEKLWKSSGEQPVIAFDTQKAWLAVNAKIQAGERPAAKRGLVRRIAGIAAAAAVILIAGIWWLNKNNTSLQVVTASAATEQIMLEDGSKVYLRKGSQLEYPGDFANNARNVRLKGEGFFEITRDEARPFTITAEDAQVRVLGTSFLVNTKHGQVELIVQTGKVQFSALNDTLNALVLVANERALLQNGQLAKTLNTDPNFNAWQTKQLIFNNTSLDQVAATLSNYYEVSIGLKQDEQPQLASTKVTASFRDQSLPSVLNELSQITSYRIRQTADAQYEISIR